MKCSCGKVLRQIRSEFKNGTYSEVTIDYMCDKCGAQSQVTIPNMTLHQLEEQDNDNLPEKTFSD